MIGTPRLSRPYVITGGRTRGRGDELPVEAMARTLSPGWNVGRRIPPEALDIMEICITPRSIAEISSRLGLPLGVTRVLVADLAADAAVHVDTAEFATASVTDRVELLELLLAGVRAL